MIYQQNPHDYGYGCEAKTLGRAIGPVICTTMRIDDSLSQLEKEVESLRECFSEVLSASANQIQGQVDPRPPCASAFDDRLQQIESRVSALIRSVVEIRQASTL